MTSAIYQRKQFSSCFILLLLHKLNFEFVLILFRNCPLFIWSETIVFFCHFYAIRPVFSTFVVSLSSWLYVIVILYFYAFWIKR